MDSGTAQIAVASITSVTSLIAILLTSILAGLGKKVYDKQKTTHSDISAVKQQLENSHVTNPSMTSNLREDLDQKHSIILDEIRGLREDHRVLNRTTVQISERVGILEQRIAGQD